MRSECYAGPADVPVVTELPVKGMDAILGNDVASEQHIGKTSSPILFVI